MSITEAAEEYRKALKQGQKEYRERLAAGLDPYPPVLDALVPELSRLTGQELPLMEIPADRIVGVKAAGRISAFSAGFLPLLDPDSEFAAKWIRLCADHLSDTGIRDPITCCEYLGDFYVMEGNKRVSVLKSFGAPRIPARVTRILPPQSDEPRIRAYREFLDFYRLTGLYEPQFTRPGDYARLLAALGKGAEEVWTEPERRQFSAAFSRFTSAFRALDGPQGTGRTEEALLLWLELYPLSDLAELSAADLKARLAGIRQDARAGEPVNVTRVPEEEKKGLLESIRNPSRSHLTVAFVHQRDPETSLWTMAHEKGRAWLEEELGDRITARSYFHADTPAEAESLLTRAAAEGADVVFTTTPTLLRPTLKAAVQFPKTRFFNCSADVPFSSVRGYYVRSFEGKFLTGAVAGAVTASDRIGYIASYPILGVPAAVNAFALGAQMTRPGARIALRWSCQPGDHTAAFLQDGISVISNRDTPTLEDRYLEFGAFGTFAVDKDGVLTPLAAPCWLWGSFYERVLRSILSGTLESGRKDAAAVSYWLGMESGVLDVTLASGLPEGVRFLAATLRDALIAGKLDPFRRQIRDQDGVLRNDGTRAFSAEELLHMDWLCENVEGRIPSYEEILPMSRETVRTLGIHREQIPPAKEESL